MKKPKLSARESATDTRAFSAQRDTGQTGLMLAGVCSASHAASARIGPIVGAAKHRLNITASLPIPAPTELLDRSEDGTLNLKRSWVTGQFSSKKLEAAYKIHSYAACRA